VTRQYSRSPHASSMRLPNEGSRAGRPADSPTPSTQTEGSTQTKGFNRKGKELQLSWSSTLSTSQMPTAVQTTSTSVEKTGVGQNLQIASNFGQPLISTQPILPDIPECTSVLSPSSNNLPTPVSLARVPQPLLPLPVGSRPTRTPPPRPTGWFRPLRKYYGKWSGTF